MKNKLIIGFIAAFFLMLGVGTASAQTSNTAGMTTEQMNALVASLKAQIAALQEQLKSLGLSDMSTKVEFKTELKRGISNNDVRLLQQLLATDPTLYPEGLTTGYFGDLTSKALSRLQTKFKLRVSGELDESTRELLNKILRAQNADREIPPGLLRAPGLEGRVIVEAVNNGGNLVWKIEVKCDSSGSGNQCDDDSDDSEDADEDEDDNDDNDDSDDNDDEDLEIEVEVSDDDARVVVQQNGVEVIFTLDETDEDDIIAKLVRRLGLTEDEIEDVIEFEYEDENDDADDEDEDDD